MRVSRSAPLRKPSFPGARVAQAGVGHVPQGPAHPHPGLSRVELHDPALKRAVGAGEGHPVAHPPAGARRVLRCQHRCAAGAAGGRERRLRHLPRLVFAVDHRREALVPRPAEEVAVNRPSAMAEAHGIADGERPGSSCLSATR